MEKVSPLHEVHCAANAKFVQIDGWQMPIHYGSQVDEHHAVRQQVGIFDLSHLTVIDVKGHMATEWLRYLLTGDVARMESGEVRHMCLCRDDGGVIDHLFVYRLDDAHYRITANAETRPRIQSWLEDERHDEIDLAYPDEFAILAVQGPTAMQLLLNVLEPHAPLNSVRALEKFHFFTSGDWLVSRTGYTGEGGLELMMPRSEAEAFWKACIEGEARPVGLGARDTLRIEAGLSRQGVDFDESLSAISAGLRRTVDLKDAQRDFIGRESLDDQMQFGSPSHRLGIKLLGRGALKSGQVVQLVGKDVGVITSATFSPSLDCSVALARVSREIKSHCDVIIRGKPLAAVTVSVPFI